MKSYKAIIKYKNGVKHEVRCSNFNQACILGASYAIEKSYDYKNMEVCFNNSHTETVFTIDIILL